MSTWKIDHIGKRPKLNNPILVEGLPGIGNVGKVAVDFLIDELNAEKMYEITSHAFPHSVFVNEDNLVELPMIEVFYKKFPGKRQDLILLGGDVQPTDEVSSYEFSEKVLDITKDFKGREVITLGGIGLAEVPKKPKVYCTGNTKKIIQKYKNGMVNDKLYGVVGPIVGVSGLLVGLAKRRNIDAISFLAETYGHPMYLGIKGAIEILKVLDKKLKLNINMGRLHKEIKEIESDLLYKTEQMSEISKQTALKKLKGKLGEGVDYIG
ncbi:hypothetical protein CMO94_01945 [Candidatus Woesearchaeota archaeon]|jgi:hypothetical protein|nr:hypothetical protein [Candidatus Woesearchaeota archaeon]|tara:strand:- start:885 stop:1682 length:798 start_codon:yes stop_codon:yes gene_type:complete